jgi:hypothetical protein
MDQDGEEGGKAEPVPVDVEDTNGNDSGSQTSEGEIKWSGKVGDQLRRKEQCLFETVGCVLPFFLPRLSCPFLRESVSTDDAFSFSVMIDCSRNGVLRVDVVRFLLRQMALMGSNMLQVHLFSFLLC